MAVLYVDEAGEEGFSPTASEWFILGGVVHSGVGLNPCLDRYEAFKARFKEDTWYFHFQRKSHDERLGFIIWMRDAPYQAFAVVVHKPTIIKRDNFRRKYFLYFYALRLMLERVTKWTADHAKEPMAIYLSARRGLKRDDLQEYFFKLQNSPFIKEDRIVWDHLIHDEIHIFPNKDFRGLQMADCVASSIAKALEASEYGTTECRYIREMRQVFARHPYSLRSSIKVWPDLPWEIARSERLDWLFRS